MQVQCIFDSESVDLSTTITTAYKDHTSQPSKYEKYLLAFFLHRKHKKDRKVIDITDATVKAAASRPGFPIIPERDREERNDPLRFDKQVD